MNARARLLTGPVTGVGRVLIADDEVPVASFLAEALALDGHHVLAVGTGREVLAQLETGAWDLVLSDINMPDMDGPSLYHAVRQRHPGFERRFVFFTGDALRPDTVRFVESTHVRILQKPFPLAEIRRVVAEALLTSAG